MSGIEFGRKVKELRTELNIKTTKLSTDLNMHPTYISKLEKGNIKKPDYDISYKLLKLLGVEEGLIDSDLENFGIISPNKTIRTIGKDYKGLSWYEHNSTILKKTADKFQRALYELIEKDYSRADKVTYNIEYLIQNKDDFAFLVSLLSFNYADMHDTDKADLLDIIQNFVDSRYNAHENGNLARK